MIRCACGRAYQSLAEWRLECQYVGIQRFDDDDEQPLELRNCACDSTMSQPLEPLDDCPPTMRATNDEEDRP